MVENYLQHVRVWKKDHSNGHASASLFRLCGFSWELWFGSFCQVKIYCHLNFQVLLYYRRKPFPVKTWTSRLNTVCYIIWYQFGRCTNKRNKHPNKIHWTLGEREENSIRSDQIRSLVSIKRMNQQDQVERIEPERINQRISKRNPQISRTQTKKRKNESEGVINQTSPVISVNNRWLCFCEITWRKTKTPGRRETNDQNGKENYSRVAIGVEKRGVCRNKRVASTLPSYYTMCHNVPFSSFYYW